MRAEGNARQKHDGTILFQLEVQKVSERYTAMDREIEIAVVYPLYSPTQFTMEEQGDMMDAMHAILDYLTVRAVHTNSHVMQKKEHIDIRSAFEAMSAITWKQRIESTCSNPECIIPHTPVRFIYDESHLIVLRRSVM